jgi:hypothetical protein
MALALQLVRDGLIGCARRCVWCTADGSAVPTSKVCPVSEAFEKTRVSSLTPAKCVLGGAQLHAVEWQSGHGWAGAWLAMQCAGVLAQCGRPAGRCNDSRRQD